MKKIKSNQGFGIYSREALMLAQFMNGVSIKKLSNIYNLSPTDTEKYIQITLLFMGTDEFQAIHNLAKCFPVED